MDLQFSHFKIFRKTKKEYLAIMGFNISKQEAYEFISQLLDNEILSDSVNNLLAEIEHCLRMEVEHNIDVWGVDSSEYADLFISKRSDLVDDSWINHLNDIYNKYRIKSISAIDFYKLKLDEDEF